MPTISKEVKTMLLSLYIRLPCCFKKDATNALFANQKIAADVKPAVAVILQQARLIWKFVFER